jgi:hypothetical protein
MSIADAKRWAAPRLSTHWHVGVDGNVSVNMIELVKVLKAELLVLEQHGFSELYVRRSDPLPNPVVEVNKRLGARGISYVGVSQAPDAGERARLVLGHHRGARRRVGGNARQGARLQKACI